MSVTTGMREYLANVAEWLIESTDVDESERLKEARDKLWQRMTQDERDYLNELVGDIFGQWL